MADEILGRLKELRTPAEEQIHDDKITSEIEDKISDKIINNEQAVDDESFEDIEDNEDNEEFVEPSEDEADDYADEDEADDIPTFDPPAAWSADGKEVFETLDLDLQEEIVNRDKAAERGLRQKLEEVAEQRKALEVEAQEIAQARANVAEALQQAVVATDNLSPPDVKLLDSYGDDYNPDEYHRQNAAYQASVTERESNIVKLNNYRTERDQEANTKRNEKMRESEGLLITKFPTWSNPEVGKKAIEEIRSYMISEGVNPEVAGGVYDSVILTMANKSMLYDRLKRAEKKGRPKKVGRPQKQRTRVKKSDVKAAMKAHQDENTVESAARLLRARRQANKG